MTTSRSIVLEALGNGPTANLHTRTHPSQRVKWDNVCKYVRMQECRHAVFHACIILLVSCTLLAIPNYIVQ